MPLRIAAARGVGQIEFPNDEAVVARVAELRKLPDDEVQPADRHELHELEAHLEAHGKLVRGKSIGTTRTRGGE